MVRGVETKLFFNVAVGSALPNLKREPVRKFFPISGVAFYIKGKFLAARCPFWFESMARFFLL